MPRVFTKTIKQIIGLKQLLSSPSIIGPLIHSFSRLKYQGALNLIHPAWNPLQPVKKRRSPKKNGIIWRAKGGQRGQFRDNTRQTTCSQQPKRSTRTSFSLKKVKNTLNNTQYFKTFSIIVQLIRKSLLLFTNTKIWSVFGKSSLRKRWFSAGSRRQRRNRRQLRDGWSIWTALSMLSWQESLKDWPFAEVRSSECWKSNANKRCEKSFSSKIQVSRSELIVDTLSIDHFLFPVYKTWWKNKVIIKAKPHIKVKQVAWKQCQDQLDWVMR